MTRFEALADKYADKDDCLLLTMTRSMFLGELVAARLSPETIELVKAARLVAFSDQGAEAIRNLDKASEAFAADVPWENGPAVQP